MANGHFQFKQFTIRQHLCAMKVGVDGVLLGAWASTDGCRRIVDIGTGTGLIALMMAQRNPEAEIQAVDVDENACIQAEANILASPFAGRIRVFHAPFSGFAATTALKYDLLVSNPPYFVRSLKGPDLKRNMARHTDSLPLEELIEQGQTLLAPSGRLALILPAAREDELRGIAVANHLNVIRKTSVVTVTGAPVKRILVELSADFSRPCVTDMLLIEDASRSYTPAYVELTKDYYLKM